MDKYLLGMARPKHCEGEIATLWWKVAFNLGDPGANKIPTLSTPLALDCVFYGCLFRVHPAIGTLAVWQGSCVFECLGKKFVILLSLEGRGNFLC